MLVTQYRAAQIADVSKQTINRWSREEPRPGYFIDIPGGPPRVDTDHPEFKSYCEKIKSDKLIDNLIKSKTGGSDEDVLRVFDAVEKVIDSRYDEEEAGTVKGLIIEELEK